MSKLNANLVNVMPDIVEKMAARYVSKQQYNEPPRNPEGALHLPGGTGEVHGGGGRTRH